VTAATVARIARPRCCKRGRRGNLYPAKQRPEQKIDAAVALMMAAGRAMAEDTNEGDLDDFPRIPVIA
jgi:phage terminase large subunit-like protein